MDNRERAMVEAARDLLVEVGCGFDKPVGLENNDYALAAAIRKASLEMIRESFSELHDDVIGFLRNHMVSVLESSDGGAFDRDKCNEFAVEAVANMAPHFQPFVDEAKTKLPFDGESDEEGWRDIDNAQRASGF